MVSTTRGFGFGGGSVSKNVTEAVNKTYEELRQLIKEAYEEGVVNGKSEDLTAMRATTSQKPLSQRNSKQSNIQTFERLKYASK